MEVLFEKLIVDEPDIQLGDVIMDTDHQGFYSVGESNDEYVLFNLDGGFWGTWKSCSSMKKDLAQLIKEHRFIHYPRDEWQLELKRK